MAMQTGYNTRNLRNPSHKQIMNLLLFHPHEQQNGRWCLGKNDRRSQHLQQVLQLNIGDSVEAGVLNGGIGTATLINISNEHWEFSFTATGAPPEPLPVTLLLALPRPKMLRRTLIDAITLGIKHIVLLNSYKVEKSYWQTPRLEEEALQELITLALEQAKDTRPPIIQLQKRFKPYIEDELPSLLNGKIGYLMHPGNYEYLPNRGNHEAIIAVGPEGGWTEYEANRFINVGFTPYIIGKRILRVETSLPVIVSRLMALM